MPEAVSIVAAFVLSVAFAWAALAKLLSYPQWQEALARYEFPHAVTPLLAAIVPFVELAAVALLLLVSIKAGAALSVAMLAGFSLAIMRARALQGEKLPCGCFGKSTERDWRLMLLRNSLLALPAALALLSSNQGGIVENASVLRNEVVPVLLVVLALLAVAWLAAEVMSVTKKLGKGGARR
ncbi:MAG: MauE/DoxX family redox-associated membrane protein [Actinomycetota bacterium]